LLFIYRILEFVVKIGSTDKKYQCIQPSSPNEGIILDFSTDNEITWQLLKASNLSDVSIE
jgi:hypothetical protein